jgi:hypothetical protein
MPRQKMTAKAVCFSALLEVAANFLCWSLKIALCEATSLKK